MAKKVQISGASPAVELTPQLQTAKAAGNLAGALGSMGDVVAKMEQASDLALSNSQIKSNSLVYDDQWSVLNNKNKDNYLEEEVFTSIDELSTAQAEAINNDTTLTEKARESLLIGVQEQVNKARNNFRSNKSTAQTKAALENTNNVLGFQIRSGDLSGAMETINAGVSSGLIEYNTGENLKREADVQVSYFGWQDRIDSVSTVDGLSVVIDMISEDKRFDEQQSNRLINEAVSKQRSLIQNQKTYEDFIDDRLKEGTLTQDQIDLIEDPIIRESVQIDFNTKLDEALGKVASGGPKKFSAFRTEEERATGKTAEPLIFTATPERRLDILRDNIRLFRQQGYVNIPSEVTRAGEIKKWRSLTGKDGYQALMWQIDSGGYDPVLKNDLRRQVRVGKVDPNNRVYMSGGLTGGVNTYEPKLKEPMTVLTQQFDTESAVLTESDKIGLYSQACSIMEREINAGTPPNKALELSLIPLRNKTAKARLAASLEPETVEKADTGTNDPLGLR